eukprot:1725287-Prymnesium_polylepis.1
MMILLPSGSPASASMSERFDLCYVVVERRSRRGRGRDRGGTWRARAARAVGAAKFLLTIPKV